MLNPDKKMSIGKDDRPNLPANRLPVSELLDRLHEIRQSLPPLTIAETNMEQELMLQLVTLRELQAEVLKDGTVPANQKAQVANAMTSLMLKLSEMQSAVYNSERFKRCEALMIRTLRQLPEEVASKFIEEYSDLVKNLEN